MVHDYSKDKATTTAPDLPTESCGHRAETYPTTITRLLYTRNDYQRFPRPHAASIISMIPRAKILLALLRCNFRLQRGEGTYNTDIAPLACCMNPDLDQH